MEPMSRPPRTRELKLQNIAGQIGVRVASPTDA